MNNNNELTYFPKYFSNKAIGVYLMALITVSLFFSSYILNWYWCLFGIVEVVSFFYFGNSLSKKWNSTRTFSKQLFWSAFAIRACYVVFIYFFYNHMTGQPFTFGSADEQFYHEMGKFGSQLIKSGTINLYPSMNEMAGGLGLSDYGYPLYLSILYTITGNSIIITRIIKAALNALTCVFLYQLAQRNFGEKTARMSGIFCMLLFNMVYYCGTHLKEVEMLFLTTLFLNKADEMIRERSFKVGKIIFIVLIGASTFFFRTALGAVLFLALGTAIVFSSGKVLNTGKKILIGVFVILTLGLGFGNKLITEATELWNSRGGQQETSMNWRSERKNGNSFAKYAGAAVFAPMIFTIPFPTMVETPEQEELKLIHGGNYTKNITSFFTIFALLTLLFSGKWREHVLPLAFIVGYLLVITFSAFAQSERFHFPTLPIAMMLTAYGVSQMKNKHKRWFLIWLGIIFVACIAWSWFKLKGRGMV